MTTHADCADCLASKTTLSEPQQDRSETDTGSWEAFVTVEQEALGAYHVLSGLHESLFYALGWASWASATQREEDAPARPWSPAARNECERYFARLWSDGRDRAGVIAEGGAVAIQHDDAWAHGISRLRPVREPYPDPDYPDRHVWVEAQSEAQGLRFISASPTVTRAAEFIPVYESLADDLPRELGWTMLDSRSEGQL